MKQDKLKDLKSKELPELRETLKKARVALAKFELEIKTGRSPKFATMITQRKEIAVLKTLISAKALESLKDNKPRTVSSRKLITAKGNIK